MKTLEKLLYNPLSFFDGKPWWWVLLFFLPWILLFLGATILWFIAPGKLTSNMAKNAPVDGVNRTAEKQLSELDKKLEKLKAESDKLTQELARKAVKFSSTTEEISKESHEELKKRLEGK